MNISEQDGKLSILTFHYLIGTRNGVEYVTEHHELGLFSVEEMYDAFRQAGLSVTYDKEGLTNRKRAIRGKTGINITIELEVNKTRYAKSNWLILVMCGGSVK